MDRIYSFAPRELIEAFGWTLFHSIWQGVLIAGILGILLLILMKFSAHSRYIISMLALLLMVATTSVTFVREYKNASERLQIRQSVISNPALVVQHFREQLKEMQTVEKGSSKTLLQLKWILFKANFQKYFPWIIFIWITGMTFLIFRFIGGMIVVNRLKYRQTISLEEEWLEKVALLIEKLKLRQEVKVLQSLIIQMPVTLGFFKPVILLPIGLLTGLSASQVESIIAHELAHIARRDYLFNLLQSFTEIIFFYHPAIWWMSSIARNERENCCDDIAIELTGDKLNYVKALANIRVEVPDTSYAMAFSDNKFRLFKRVKRLLNPHTMKTNFKEGFIASCILFTGIILLTLGATGSTGEFNRSVTSNKDTLKSANQIQDVSTGNSTQNSAASQKETEKLRKENEKMISEMNQLNKLSENLEKELEVAFGDLDELSTNEVLKGIKGAMNEMDLNLIVNEALKGAKAALNNMDINVIVNEGLQNEAKNQQNEAALAQEALKGAQAALQEMDLNLIVNEALKGAEGALKEMNLEKIINESIKTEIEEEIKEKKKAPTKENKYLPIISKGTASWNLYRKENQQVLPNLSYISLSELNLDGINLVSISLADASIEKSSLNKADLSGINAINLEIRDSQLNNANFNNANLTGSQFNTNILNNSNFKSANLQFAEFYNCNLNNSDFRKANLRGTVFSGGSLDNCNFKGAIANKNSKFPAGFNPEKQGIIME